MRALVLASIALLLASPAFCLQAGASGPAGGSSPRIEWQMDLSPIYGRTITRNFTDLDGDGACEMMIRYDRNYTFYDLPSYDVKLSLDDPNIREVRFARSADATGMEILVTYQTDSFFNLSFISGKDFREIWRTPDIDGGLAGIPKSDVMRDCDADGQPEFVLPVYNGTTACFLVIDASKHAVERSHPRTGEEQPYFPYCIQDLDGDAAFELLTAIWDEDFRGFTDLCACDGATGERQWTVSPPQNCNFLMAYDRFSDIDNDSGKELVLPYNSTGDLENMVCGLNVYSGKDGAFEWGIGPWPGRLAVHSVADLDGDAWKELLMERRSQDPNGVPNVEYSVFGPKENRTLWTTGPIVQKSNETYIPLFEDIDDDGAPEVVITKRVSHGENGVTAVFQVISGKDFTVRWTSRELSTFALSPETYLPSDGSAPRILIVEQTNITQRNPNSTLEIISTDGFRSLFNGSYPGQLQVFVDDLNGDSVPDLLLDYAGCELLDGNSLRRMWRTELFDGQHPGIGAADLCGGPAYELLTAKLSGGYRTVNGTSLEWHSSVLSVRDPETLGQLWSSQDLDGEYDISYLADIDNDSNVEALYRVYKYDIPYSVYMSFVIIEFPKEASSSGNPWPPGINLRPPTITIDRPRNGEKVSGTVKMTGTAEDDTFLAGVMIRIDGGDWVDATWRPDAGNRTGSWNATWDSSGTQAGTHTIYARAFDGLFWSPEASVTVEVGPPGSTAPGLPAPVVTVIPDAACLALVAVILVAAAAYVYWRARRK